MNQIVIITRGNKGIRFATAKKFLFGGDKVIQRWLQRRHYHYG